MFHILTENIMHTMPHTLHVLILHMLIMLTHIMYFYMSRCTHAPIVAAKVIWPSFVMIDFMFQMIIRKTNTLGSNKIWVPNSTPLSIDVGTYQDSKT